MELPNEEVRKRLEQLVRDIEELINEMEMEKEMKDE